MVLLLVAVCLSQQNPAANEQLLIYELNRARNNPQRYASENGLGNLLDGIAASPPLAMNTRLVQSSRFHANEMATYNYFGHQSQVTNDWPNKMVRDAGYALNALFLNNDNNVESIAAGYSDVLVALRELIEDAGHNPPGHRYQLLATGPGASFWLDHREVGAGYATNGSSTYVRYYAIHTAYVNSSNRFLTGVVYNDGNANGRYDLGEGLGNVTVSRGAASTTTNSAGSWSLAVSTGSYTVTAGGGSFVGTGTANVTVSGSNIEIDFESGTAAGEVNFANQSGSPPADSDADGLADSWETTHFGNLAQNGTGNPDGDAYTNAAEYAGGSNPTVAASVPGDVDGDGLPDSWETSEFGNLSQTATGNFDGDAYNNLAEYNAGTDPTDAASYPGSTPAPAPKKDGGGDGGVCGLTGLEALVLLALLRRRRF